MSEKMITLKEALIEKAQSMGWKPDCYTYRGQAWVDFYKIYPTGERYCLHIDGNSIAHDVWEKAEGFDSMGYAIEQYKAHSTKSIKKLLATASTIEADIKELADVLDTCEREYEDFVEFGPII